MTILPAFGAIVLSCLVLEGHGHLESLKKALLAHEEAFAAFIVKHDRAYKPGSHEYALRRSIFEKAAGRVEHHNRRPGKTWTAGINKLADRTDMELATLRGWRHVSQPKDGAAAQVALPSTEAMVPQLPKEHSWMNLTSMQEVQDQGGCGSCWAFASATVLRAHSEIWMKDPRKFSVQDIVSCTPNPQECGGTGGCQGATVELALDYVYKHGCRTEAELPYTETDTEGTCPQSLMEARNDDEPSNHARPSASFGMLGWSKLPENKLNPLKVALVTQGPVAVSISSAYSWNQYESGVLNDCPQDAIIDHAVVLIGYGETKAFSLLGEGEVLKYWHLQNSWGTDWGENGYLRMLRQDDEEKHHCGWDNNPEIGSGCKGGPSKVYVCGMCGLLYDTVIPHFVPRGKSGKAGKRTAFLEERLM